MSQPEAAQAAKLVIGLFSAEEQLIGQVAHVLQDHFGAIDLISPWFDFDFTDYYYAEMGRPLRRRMIVFHELVAQESLADIKCRTNVLEQHLRIDKRRRINIDPGYLLKERFVLATGKNYTHRIYIGKGIYADLTLIFQKGGYQPLPWTYPDYAHKSMRDFLLQIRCRYASDMKVTADASPNEIGA
jgi:hypothetical protein